MIHLHRWGLWVPDGDGYARGCERCEEVEFKLGGFLVRVRAPARARVARDIAGELRRGILRSWRRI